MCPKSLCSAEGKEYPCRCKWHATTNGKEKGFKEEEVKVRMVGNIVEYVLPSQLSQSGLLGRGEHISSCTVISTIACSSVLRGEILLQDALTVVPEIVEIYKGIMTKGNKLYEIISGRAQQLLLPVEEVIQYSELQVYMPDGIIPIVDVSNLATHLLALRDSTPILACVLICPPDKSVALCIQNNTICLLDSHYHYTNGAVISLCDSNNFLEFCEYLESFFKTYFNTSIQGSNLIPLQLICRNS